MDQKVVYGVLGGLIVTAFLIWWCHKNMACGKCKKSKTEEVKPYSLMGPTAAKPPRGYMFQNTGGPFKIMMVEKSGAFPQTPTLTLYVDAKGQATVSSAMTIYKPRIRRHEARYNINPRTGNETAVPVGEPNTYWCTYDTKEGLVLGLGENPTPLSTLVVADTYVPLGTFSMQVQGSGVAGMQAIPEESQRGACQYRLKKPSE